MNQPCERPQPENKETRQDVNLKRNRHICHESGIRTQDQEIAEPDRDGRTIIKVRLCRIGHDRAVHAHDHDEQQQQVYDDIRSGT